jgi:hypothetical protein
VKQDEPGVDASDVHFEMAADPIDGHLNESESKETRRFDSDEDKLTQSVKVVSTNEILG